MFQLDGRMNSITALSRSYISGVEQHLPVMSAFATETTLLA